MTTSMAPGAYPFFNPQTYALGSKLTYMAGGSIDDAIIRHWHANVGSSIPTSSVVSLR